MRLVSCIHPRLFTFFAIKMAVHYTCISPALQLRVCTLFLPKLESCMIRLPLLAFGFTINDKTFGFQLFHVSTFLQLSAFYTQNSSAFRFQLLASGFQHLAFGFRLLALGFQLLALRFGLTFQFWLFFIKN